jgi:hypothetical protein
LAAGELEAGRAVGRLASQVAAIERESPAVEPVAPDGRFELVPLFFVMLSRSDLDRVLAAVNHVRATEDGSGHPVVGEAVLAYTGRSASARQLVQAVDRLGQLVSVSQDVDVELLRDRFDEVAAAGPGRPCRIVLNTHEYSAYLRVTRRILETWHAADPLEHFVYRGTERHPGIDCVDGL